MIIIEHDPINHLYELPFEFKFLEPSSPISQGFSLRACREVARGGVGVALWLWREWGCRAVMLMVMLS